MRVVASRKVEDCFDGSAVFTYLLSEVWTEARIRQLAPLGELEYFATFPRPLFRLRSKSGVFVKGIAGSKECRVIFPQHNRQQIKDRFEEMLQNLASGREVVATDSHHQKGEGNGTTTERNL